MYMYMSSPSISFGGSSRRDCCPKYNYWWNNPFEQTAVPTRTKKFLFVSAYAKDSGYTKVSCGVRQSALICNPRCRRVTGAIGYRKTFYIQEKCSYAALCSGQRRVCRCLGWDEEEEREEANEDKDECLSICELGDEAQEILSLLIEDSCRKKRVFNGRESSKSSRAGKSLERKAFYAERTIPGRVCMDRSCCAEKIDVGNGAGHLGSEYRCGRFVRESAEKGTAEKKGSVRKSLFREREMCCKAGSKASTSNLRSRIEWISSLKLENEEEIARQDTYRTDSGESMNQLRMTVSLASGAGSHKEETLQRGNEKSGVEKSWNKTKNDNITSGCTVETQKQEKFRKGAEEAGFDIGANHCTVQFQKANQKTDSKTSFSGQRTGAQWSSTVVSTHLREVGEESTKKSGFEVSMNDSSNVRHASIEEQTKSVLVNEGESSGAGLISNKNPRDQLDQMESNKEGHCTPRVPSDNLRKISGWSCATELEEREKVIKNNEKFVVRQQDELHTSKKFEKISQKKGAKLVPGMASDDSRKITRLSSISKMEGQELIAKTTETSTFQKQDELVKNYGRSSSTELEEVKSLTEENAETASKRFGTLISSNRTAQKFSKDCFNSGSNDRASSVPAQEQKTSTVVYEKGKGDSQELLKTSSYSSVLSESSHSAMHKSQSTRIIEQANRTPERLAQSSSSKTEVDVLKSSSGYETGSKNSQKLPSNPSQKLSSNDILRTVMESNKKKYAVETETDTTSGKSTQTRLSNESDYSLGFASAEGNEKSTEKTTDESPLELCNPQLSTPDFPSEGPSEEVWAIAGWSSREEFEELQYSGKIKQEKDSKPLTSEETSDELQKSTDEHPISEVEKGQMAISEKRGKVIMKRQSRGIWSSFVDFCCRRWGLSEESDNSTLKSGSGRPSTESQHGEKWFSVPDFEDQEYIVKDKSHKDKKEVVARSKANVLISGTEGNTGAGLKEAEKTQKEKAQKSAQKWALEESADESQLTRRRVSSTANKGHERQERAKEDVTDVITDPGKTESSHQGKVQNAAINWSLEGTSADESTLSSEPVSSRLYEECDKLESKRGKTTFVDKDELDEQGDTERLIQSSEIEEKNKMTKKLKRNKQVPKETFVSWEEALILESEQRREDEKFMREALSEARMAADAWEVPIGAVLVQNGRIIARAHNLVEQTRDATAHAEMLCIRYASSQLKTWRLAESTLYVTLEPCAMCAGAILQARIGNVVWGAPNKLLGADGSWVSLFPNQGVETMHATSEEQHPLTVGPVHPFHPNIKIRRGVLKNDCSDMMQQFFKLRRKKEKKTQSNSCFSLTNVPSKMFTKIHEIFSVFCL
ncbi:hypothetical protein SUGI_0097370 [Cryptomeria japonica]|uniref:tRNA(adenine(34)) deaminase, chloroplastic n=1 Tax=Cryptomeria japonica TaxID=3369 RepID=UPI002408B818|nr:tRNA(adenine(34)) deaminase, chloroplastic [Cryptomeria japonica]GLJ08869.1 hypothetical protein SUGI_0097370 [Cryptomeria japonica]